MDFQCFPLTVYLGNTTLTESILYTRVKYFFFHREDLTRMILYTRCKKCNKVHIDHKERISIGGVNQHKRVTTRFPSPPQNHRLLSIDLMYIEFES